MTEHLLPARVPNPKIKGRKLDAHDRALLLHHLSTRDAADIAHEIGCSAMTVRNGATNGRLYGATRAGILAWLARQ